MTHTPSYRTRRRFGVISPVSLAWLAICTTFASLLLWNVTPTRARPFVPSAGRVVSKPIEQIKVGDTVLAYDFVTGQNVPRKVYELHKNLTTSWVDITLNDGSSITATRFHPFWVESEDGWIAALDLHPRMALRLEDGRIVPIADVRVRLLDMPEPTYNFEVEKEHNYYAGSAPILLHNGPGPGYYEATDFIVYEFLKGTETYIGRTRVDWYNRYSSRPEGWNILHRGLTYDEARGLEQHYIEKFGVANIRNGIDPTRTDDAAKAYRKAAEDYLQRNGTAQIPGC